MLPCTLRFREGLSLDMTRLWWIINSEVSEQEERILKSSKLADWSVEFKWDMTGLDDSLSVVGEIHKCSHVQECKLHVVWPPYDAKEHTYLSVDAVPGRICESNRARAPFAHEYQNIWESLLQQEDRHPVQSCLAFLSLKLYHSLCKLWRLHILCSCSDSCELIIYESLLIKAQNLS